MNIERWGLFEYRLSSPTQYENPFRDVMLTAAFTCEAGTKTVEGFYDGDDTWVIRFMPEHLGTYSFLTAHSTAEQAALCVLLRRPAITVLSM